MNRKDADKVTKCTIATALISTVAIEIFTIDKSSPGLLWIIVLLGLWAIAPYVFLFFLASQPEFTGRQSIVVMIGSICLSIFGVGLLLDAFFIHLGAQSGLVFIFLPIWQWVGCIVVAVISALVKGKRGS
jgi:hypothetical protein